MGATALLDPARNGTDSKRHHAELPSVPRQRQQRPPNTHPPPEKCDSSGAVRSQPTRANRQRQPGHALCLFSVVVVVMVLVMRWPRRTYIHPRARTHAAEVDDDADDDGDDADDDDDGDHHRIGCASVG